jgi:hypothetical protein
MTHDSELAHRTNPENGEVTLYLKNTTGGPIITGKSLTEAMLKWQEAFALYRFTQSTPHARAYFSG